MAIISIYTEKSGSSRTPRGTIGIKVMGKKYPQVIASASASGGGKSGRRR
ncbi:hypothetical protein GS462_24400 [Rhodococcus hoagii]|nr:hypothetical protein [Prescottella equi]